MSVISWSFFLLLCIPCLGASAQDRKFYAGQLHTFERSERYEAVLGGAVTYLRPYGHDEFERASNALLIEGVLSQETLAHVRRLLPHEPGFTVYWDSPGGDLAVGIAIGQLMNAHQAIAVIGVGAQCKSACALAFLGAATRYSLGEPQALGFHRQYRLVDGKVVYGDAASDSLVIATYLRSIGVSGVTPEEVVGTTGEAGFSERSLKERGIISQTRAELRSRYLAMVSYSGLTAFESLSLVCAKYDRIDPRGASPTVMAIVFTCSGRIPALREPLLRAVESGIASSVDEDLRVLSRASASRTLRLADPGAVEAFNQTAETESGSYQRWHARRSLVRERQRSDLTAK